MRVLGIDPGSRSTGWGVVVMEGGSYKVLASGVIRTDPDADEGVRLLTILDGIARVISDWQPECASIEAIFAHKSASSALVLGQARGVALVALARAGLKIHSYNAMTVKQTVAGHGRADKAAVGRMVEMLVGEPMDGPHDRADAIAIAITHHAHARLLEWQR